MVGFSFAPQDWAACNGQLLPISQYEALYSLLGTTYGGDGMNTFGLPDFRSRVVVGTGQGSGLSRYVAAQTGGTESVSLSLNQLPSHAHPATAALNATSQGTRQNSPLGGYPAASDSDFYGAVASGTAQLGPGAVTATATPAGNSAAHGNIQPVLAMNYIIALEGIYPSRP
jgi:microcystin-dependent protein